MQQTKRHLADRMHGMEMDMHDSERIARPLPAPPRPQRHVLLLGGIALVVAAAVAFP